MKDFSKEAVIMAVKHYSSLGVSREQIITFLMVHFNIGREDAEKYFDMA